MEQFRKKKSSGVKVRKKNGQKCDNGIPGSDVTRRQRLDLKGPRVKHVCRSASIVLGQPQATFPLDKRMEKVQVKPVQGEIHTNWFRLIVKIISYIYSYDSIINKMEHKFYHSLCELEKFAFHIFDEMLMSLNDRIKCSTLQAIFHSFSKFLCKFILFHLIIIKLYSTNKTVFMWHIYDLFNAVDVMNIMELMTFQHQNVCCVALITVFHDSLRLKCFL
jgi:hypothetical protein